MGYPGWLHTILLLLKIICPALSGYNRWNLKYNDDDDENYHYKLNLNIYIAVNMYIALLWQPLYV